MSAENQMNRKCGMEAGWNSSANHARQTKCCMLGMQRKVPKEAPLLSLVQNLLATILINCKLCRDLINRSIGQRGGSNVVLFVAILHHILSIRGDSNVVLFVAILHHKSCAPWAVWALTGQIVPAWAIVVAQSAITAAIGSNPSLLVSKGFMELRRSAHALVGREDAASSPAQGWFTRWLSRCLQVLCARLHRVFGLTSARIFNGHLLKTMLQLRHVFTSGTCCSNSRTMRATATRLVNEAAAGAVCILMVGNLKFHHLCTSCGQRHRSRPLHSVRGVAETQLAKATTTSEDLQLKDQQNVCVCVCVCV